MLPFRSTLVAFAEAVSLLSKHRRLIVEMARREVTERHAGQLLGILWAFGQPFFLISLYVVMFGFIFKARIGGTYELPLDYTAYILSGLIPWLAFQEYMNKACSAVAANGALVRQMVFPVVVLPMKSALPSLASMLLMLALLALYVLFSAGRLHATYVLLPVLVAVQYLAMLGVGFTLSAVGVFVRDIKDLIALLGLAGTFLVPALYLPQWVPDRFLPLIYANPFSYLVWCYQDVLYFGRMEHPVAWVVTPLLATVVFAAGYRIFSRLSPQFGAWL